MECSPSLRSECMVLPYLKGLIIKKHFYLFDLVLSWVYFCYHIFLDQIYNKWYQSYNILGLDYQIHIIAGLDIQQVVSEL